MLCFVQRVLAANSHQQCHLSGKAEEIKATLSPTTLPWTGQTFPETRQR